ncbi:MAG: energy transducer TonB [Sphingomicrobium sp.]
MYQARPSARDRAATIALVLAIHAALAFALINLSGNVREVLPEDVVEMFDVTNPPPPPVVEQLPEPEKAKPKEEEGAASAKNIRSKATPVAAPKPPIVLPIPQPMPATTTPNSGNDRTQGSSTVVGPGTGAGGQGTGTGSGGSGSGTGGGGGGGVEAGVKLIRGITNRDYPPAIQRSWPRGGRIYVRVRVQPDGRVSQCDVMRSFGDQLADQWTCSLILQRGAFRAATDSSGRPIAAWFGYVQSDLGKFDR